MPVIYGNPGTGFERKAQQPAYVPKELEPCTDGRRKGKPVVRSDGKWYPSASAAAREMDYCGWGSNISECCRGKRKRAFGYSWRYGGEADA